MNLQCQDYPERALVTENVSSHSLARTSSHPTSTLAPHFPTYTLARMKKKIVLAVQVLHMTSPTCTLAHLRTLGPAPHPTPLASDCPKNTISSLKLIALKSFLITIEMMVVTEPELRVLCDSLSQEWETDLQWETLPPTSKSTPPTRSSSRSSQPSHTIHHQKKCPFPLPKAQTHGSAIFFFF